MSYPPMAYPSLTVAIPAYNESSNIERVIRGFLLTQYPNLVEVFVSDGGSNDGTQDIVKQLSLEDSRVKLLDNPLKIQSAALNLILAECTGEIFLRADAHSDYAPDYIERCAEALLSTKALNVGGAQRFVAKTPFQAGVALAARSLLGNGGAKYRNPDYSGYGTTVYLGCFWKEVLVKVGAYSTNNGTNEDSELNKRIIKNVFELQQKISQDAEVNQKLGLKSNQAIYIDSKICVWYYPRSTWKSLLVQYFKYGRSRYITSVKHSQDLQIRGKLPFLIFTVIFTLSCLAIFFKSFRLPLKAIILFSLIITLWESLRITRKFNRNFSREIWRGSEEEIPSFVSRWFICAIVLLTMPLAHFSGYAYQLFHHKVLRISSW
jgi:succinoglycan biosynthesis protein ExoA